MALEQTTVAERRQSPNYGVALSSNNPFRNRASSPVGQSSGANSIRPVSKNPFLATFEAESLAKLQTNPASSLEGAPQRDAQTGRMPSYSGAAEELFKNLTLNENTDQNGTRSGPPRRTETLPMKGGSTSSGALRTDDRRPSQSKWPGDFNLSTSPNKTENRRPRRNSESSVIEKKPMSEEERRRRDRHNKEREGKHRDGKPRPSRSKKAYGLDVIDKLDVTGIYGPGLFHHDGPFDACNPHRNRRKDHRAPMQAFPANSANNAIGGSGPVNKSIDYNQFHGRGAEGFTDYATSGHDNVDQHGKMRPAVDRALSFDPKDRHMVHGEESVGLGTSTFLEGAPASRTAIQRRESEAEASQGSGLARKKSLAQRFRGISQPRRPYTEGGRVMSPDAKYDMRSPASPDAASGTPLSAGGRTKMHEKNPFFDEHQEDKKDDSKVVEAERPKTAKSMDGQKGPDAGETEGKPAGGGGFLNRVKSLKGGKRPKPEKPAP